jgi:D-alanyl-D-alanine carboxypeptidase
MYSFRVQLLAAVLASLPPLAQAAAPPALDTEKISKIVTQALKEYNIPGAVLDIDTPGNRWVHAFGLANWQANRPVKPRDHFAIRSITKSFTVTRVLQLIAASGGAVTLDDPIGNYLPNIPNGDIITIRQLGDMTSGLYNYTVDPDFQKAFGTDPTRHFPVTRLLKYALYSKKHSPINFQPGAEYQYSNTNTLLLGELVVALSGKPFANTLNTAILRPLGLGGTIYVKAVDLPHPAATGYQGFFDNEPDPIAINSSSLSYAGAMASTAGDLASWGEVLVGGELLPANLQKQRFRAHRTAGDPNSPIYDRYGLGMGEIAGWWGHTGSGVGFEAAVFHNIDSGVTFAILLNASNSTDSPARIFCRLLPLLHAGDAPAEKTVCDTIK